MGAFTRISCRRLTLSRWTVKPLRAFSNGQTGARRRPVDSQQVFADSKDVAEIWALTISHGALPFSRAVRKSTLHSVNSSRLKNILIPLLTCDCHAVLCNHTKTNEGTGMTATLENTAGYTQQELDRFNAMVARETDGMDEYEAQQYKKT